MAVMVKVPPLKLVLPKPPLPPKVKPDPISDYMSVVF
jgi:hypothetical protein